ncbi:MAG: helix-turn-helix domain-containing protein [Sagittula sp.]|uniref:helix-turn-helix domain-containing protein n=1 Tax=Sagittula sp. TaxID=2038081 RepID=UPI004058E0E4
MKHTSTGLEFIGARMRSAREASGYSQVKCAALLDVSERSYKSYELGKREPSLRTAVDFSERLQVDLRWLILGEETVPTNNLIELSEEIAAALFEQASAGAFTPKKFGRIARYVLEQTIAKGTDPQTEVKEVLSIFQDEAEE